MGLARARFSLGISDEEKSRALAHELERKGFKVQGVSKRGFALIGTPEQFESTFAAKVREVDSVFQFESMPKIPDSFGLKNGRVYFPSKPTYF